MCLVLLLRTLTLQVLPGIRSVLHFLQILTRISNGIFILALCAILLAL